jgi:hypothetical protein
MENVQQIFDKSCSFGSCHGANKKAANLQLTADRACSELVDQPSFLFPDKKRVVPGNPDDSFLFHKLTGNLSGTPVAATGFATNDLMPWRGTILADSDLELVRSWIEAGAPCDPGMNVPPKNDPNAVAISKITASTATPVAGQNVELTVELEKPAPDKGLNIVIEPMSTAMDAPKSVFAKPGETSVKFIAGVSRPTSRFALRVSAGESKKEIVLRVSGIQVAEVLSDPFGADDRYQYIKLRNTSDVAISLAGYRLNVGTTDYAYTTVALTGSLPAGGCMVVGGPSSGFQNGEASLGQVVDFTPDLPNASQVRGYAVFDDTARAIDGVTTPVDTMIVGTSGAPGLLNPDAQAASPFCSVAPEGFTMRRIGNGTCVISEMRPNQCD